MMPGTRLPPSLLFLLSLALIGLSCNTAGDDDFGGDDDTADDDDDTGDDDDDTGDDDDDTGDDDDDTGDDDTGDDDDDTTPPTYFGLFQAHENGTVPGDHGARVYIPTDQVPGSLVCADLSSPPPLPTLQVTRLILSLWQTADFMGVYTPSGTSPNCYDGGGGSPLQCFGGDHDVPYDDPKWTYSIGAIGDDMTFTSEDPDYYYAEIDWPTTVGVAFLDLEKCSTMY